MYWSLRTGLLFVLLRVVPNFLGVRFGKWEMGNGDGGWGWGMRMREEPASEKNNGACVGVFDT